MSEESRVGVDKERVTILVGDLLTREELLGEPEEVEFLQPRRPPFWRPVEDEGESPPDEDD